jgi:hypothetical protein
MEVTPSMKSCSFEELDPGDLFFMHHETEWHVAVAVKDPKAVNNPNAKDKMVLLLGPGSSAFSRVPVFRSFPQRMSVVSFGRSYTLQLPCDRKSWLDDEPSADGCLVLANDRPCMRATFGFLDQNTQCYIDIKEGNLITTSAGNFAYPSGHCAYTLDWVVLTAEKEPREILSSPHRGK